MSYCVVLKAKVNLLSENKRGKKRHKYIEVIVKKSDFYTVVLLYNSPFKFIFFIPR